MRKQVYQVTAWYSSFSDKPAVHVHPGDANHFAKGSQRAAIGKGTVLEDSSGVMIVFHKNVDDRSYVHELRLPWAALDPKFRPASGTKLGVRRRVFLSRAIPSSRLKVTGFELLNPPLQWR